MFKQRAIAVGAGLMMAVAVGAQPAAATTATISVPFTSGTKQWFTTSRTVTTAGSNIYAAVQAADSFSLAWYKCSDRNTRGSFVVMKQYSKVLGTNFLSGSKFCLASQGNGSSGESPGAVYWNVFSA